jgi:hypothetical protein
MRSTLAPAKPRAANSAAAAANSRSRLPASGALRRLLVVVFLVLRPVVFINYPVS